MSRVCTLSSEKNQGIYVWITWQSLFVFIFPSRQCVCLCISRRFSGVKIKNLVLLQEISRGRKLILRLFSFEGEVKNDISCEDRLVCDFSIKNAYDIVYSSIKGLPGGSDGKESACSAGDLGSIPGLGRSPGGGHGNPLQYSRLENPMYRGAWWATVYEVAKSQTWLSD